MKAATPPLPAVFGRVPWRPGRIEDGWIIDAFGQRIPQYVMGGIGWRNHTASNFFGPQFDESLFEWEALFNAVVNAGDDFTMIELGCGYGRWLLFAAGALRAARPDLTPKLIGVEADRTHYRWATEVAALNGVPVDLLHAAVGSEDGEADFLVLDDPAAEYGQSLIYPWTEEIVVGMGQVFATTKVPVVSLSTILRDLDHVDFIDADIQGAEADVFESAACELDGKVASVFIETHGDVLERRLCALFARLGWRCQHNYSPYGERATPYGPMLFNGGVQVFRNPRFMQREAPPKQGPTLLAGPKALIRSSCGSRTGTSTRPLNRLV